MTTRLALCLGLVSLLGGVAPSPAAAQAPERKIAEMELLLLGVSATVEPVNPVIPKNTDAGVRIVVRAGGRELSFTEAAAFFGAGFWVEGELAGFSLEKTLTLSSRFTGTALSADPLLLPIPGFRLSGDYELNNLRVMAGGRPVLEVQPRHVAVKVIEQVLVTSVTTRPLTLDEIRAKGIVLDSDDYYAFEFTLGLKLESKAVNITFPVAFDRQGVPVPQFIAPPPPPTREGIPFPTIIPVLFETDAAEEDGAGGKRLPPVPGGGGEVRIPSVIIIPGNVGYLKQFFSAKLFVANGAPVGSGLTVRDVTATLALPFGPDHVKGYNANTGKNDDPLALPNLLRDGQEVLQPETMPVRGVGPDGEPGTEDDVDRLSPAEQGEAEFLIRGESEGFHTIGFDIRAVLEGLVTGPVKIKGKASGAVLVRNPYFDVSFMVPGIVRSGEPFSVFATLTNLSESSAANNVGVTLPEDSTSGAKLVGTLPPVIPTIGPGESKTLELRFLSQKTGQVVASYLRFDPADGQQRPTGSLQLSVGIGERGVPLSPDTLVLPAAVDTLPAAVVEAAMRVLGQAWSIANAPAGTLPKGIARTSRNVVTQKALALAEAGLRVSLGQQKIDAVRDVAFDFWGGQPLDPGFDQLLRTTDAGGELRRAIGLALAGDPDFTTPLDLESALAAVAASGPDFASFAVTGGDPATPLEIMLFDASQRQTSTPRAGTELSEIPGAALFPLGTQTNAPVLGIVATAAGAPYRLDLHSPVDAVADVSITLPRGDGTFVRGDFRGVVLHPGTVARIAHDPLRPDEIVLAKEGESVTRAGAAVAPQGPRLVSATLIGPETLQGASPFGFQAVALFDRVVDGVSAARKENYKVPKNAAHGAKRQLSGRLVFVSLEQPEGPYVPTTFSVLGGVSDPRGNEGPAGTEPMGSRLEDPGAVVSGRVFQADGTPVSSGAVTYVNNSDLSCYRPNEAGFAALPLDSDGHYEFRYVRQDNCGTPFKIVTVDPATGGRRQASAFVRAAGEAITLDLALFGRGAVEGTVSELSEAGPKAVPGASVVAFSQTDPQIGGATTTDGLGHYLIDGLTVGPIVVKAGKGPALGSKPGRIERAGTTTTVNITLDGQAARVYGKVYKVEDGEQAAVPGAYVLFKHGGLTLGVTTTGADGGYAFDGVPAGQFEVSAALNTRDRDSKQGVAVAGTSVSRDLLIVIPKPVELATVSGQVFMPGGQTPASDVVVSIGDRGVVSADGLFTIRGVAVRASAQTVTARSRDGRRSGSTTVLANEPRLYGGLRIVLSGLGNAAFRVLDESGKPVKGQPVSLLWGCSDPCGCAKADTDADGIALFENVPYGSISAQAVRRAATFTDVARGTLAIQADGATVLTTMSFAGAGRVEGTVKDPFGNPVHGADVALWSKRFESDGFSVCGLKAGFTAGARTGLDGKFRFTGINLGAVSLSAKQDFFGSGAIGNKGSLTEPGQTLTLDMKFADTTAGVLSGNVFLPGGAPAGAGVEVAVEGPLPEVKVTTDTSGSYEFPHILPEGYYQLTARDPVGGGLARLSVTLKRQAPFVQDVQLRGRGTVRVQVVSGDDEPLESALVKLTETAYPSRRLDQTVRPGNQGRVLFLDVYEGPLRIDVSDPFARSGSATAVLGGPGEEIDVKVEVTPTGRVTGHFLMPDETRIPYGTVTLKAGGKVVGQTTTLGSGDVGRFSFDYVPVGPVTLDAQDPLTARVGFKSGTLDHEGDPPLELDVVAQGLGRVFGVVKRGGSPQALARVEISSGAYRETTLSDGSGAYDVSGVPEGRVTVTASLNDNGFLAGSSSAALEGDGTSVEIDVALREAGSVSGHIVPASEEDREAGRFPASVVRLSVGGTGGGSQETSSRPDGSFSFDVVPAGRVSFTADVVDSIDGGSASVDIVSGENAVEILLHGVGSLEGTAFASNDPEAPPVDGWITFSGTAFPSGGRVQVGTDGKFRLPEVLAGEFTARLQHGQGALALYGSASGTVAAGQELAVRIGLQPSGEIRGTVFRPAATPEGKRPAFGAEVKVVLAKGGTIPLLAQEDGSFSVKGVPLGDFSVRVFDPVSDGRAVRAGRSLADSDRCGAESTCHDVGEIRIDDQPPALSFVQPAPGSTKSALSGLLVLELTPEAAADVDPASVSVTYPRYGTKGAADFAWDPETRRFTGSLVDSWLVVGGNTVVASVKDLSGNVGQAQVTWTVAGGTVRGRVIGGDLLPKAGATVRLGSLETTSQGADGAYGFFGLRPGPKSAKAIDAETGLESPSRSGTLVDGAELVLPDLQLPAAGRLHGTVLRKDGTLADGVMVKWSSRSGVTKDGGKFDLGLVPVGSYALAAEAPNGDVGAASASVTAGASASATIRLNGVGQVEVTVETAGGDPAANASVTVVSSAPFPRPHSGKKTGSLGEPVVYDRALSGTITATSSLSGLGGETTGYLDDGGLLRLIVALAPAGRISGVVSRAAGGGPAVEVSVKLTGPKNATTQTDPEGLFVFENVPFGSFQLAASTPEGDFGNAAGALTSGNPDVSAPITLNGLGTVTVHVTDADGADVAGASVTVSAVNRSASATADDTGRATVANVRAAASVSVTATHPTTGAKGDETGGPLAPSGTLEIEVALERLGTVSGTVYGPGGKTPVDGVEVWLSGTKTVTHDGGQFSFPDRKLRTYTLSAQVGGRKRAQAAVKLDGPSAVQDLVLIGVGTVQGTVTLSGGAPAAGASVYLQSAAPLYGGAFTTATVAGGAYAIPNVPIGGFTITATLGTDSRQETGTVTADGEQVTIDIALLDNAIALPRTLTDGNGLDWKVSPNGSLQRGWNFYANEGTPRLTLVRDGTSASFSGPTCPTNVKCAPTEENGREIILGQPDLLGLEATRKVFVPADGYFVRQLDLLRNPGPAPVTVSILRESQVGGTVVLGTSSGDPDVTVGDHWITIDDTDDENVYGTDSYYYDQHASSAVAPVAYVLGGAGGTDPQALDATQPAANRTLLAQRWDDLTIEPGGTVGLLALYSAQADRTRAQAAAERLVELPPEALAGLSPEEAGAILNFQVPADLVSALPALPPNDGVVTGRALAADGETPSDTSNGTRVVFSSRSPYYGRPLAQTASNGDFAFRGVSTPDSPALVPRADFDITATLTAGHAQHPFAVAPATAAVSFPSEGTIDLTNVAGRVLRVSSSSTSASQAPASAVDDDLGTSWRTAVGDAANKGQSPFFEIVLPGDATVREVRIRGTHLGDASAIHGGRIDLFDAAGAVVWTEAVALPLVDGRRSGDFAVPEVAGVRRVRFTSTDDRSTSPGLSEMRVLGEADLGPAREAKPDLVFRGTGMLEARVVRADGSPLSAWKVWLGYGTQTSTAVNTDANGTFLWRILPTDLYTLSAKHTSGTPIKSVTGVLVSADGRKVQEVTFDAFGSVAGTVTTANGGPINAAVKLAAEGFVTRSTNSAATSGAYAFSDVPPGTYTLTVTDNRTAFALDRSIVVAASQATTEDFTLRPVTTLAVKATFGSLAGPPLTSGRVYAQERPGGEFRSIANVSSGQAQITVTGPDVTVRVQTTGTPIPSIGEAPATFTEGQAVQVPVVVPGFGTVTGSLRARDGKVVAPAGYTLNAAVLDPADPTKKIEAVVGADGRFTLSSVPVGALVLRGVLTEGFAGYWSRSRAELPVTVAAHGETVSQDALVAAGSIAYAGKVEAWEIRPSGGATVGLLLGGRAYADVTALPDPLLEVYAPDGALVATNDNRSTSDKNSELSLTAAASRYVILVRGAKGATGGYRLASWKEDEDHVFRPYAGRLFSGVVTRIEDGALVSGQALRLVRRGATPAEDVVLIGLAAGPDGAFSFPGLWSGSLALEAIDADGVALARREFDVAAGEDPGPLDLTVPVHGIVIVHVMRGTDPVPGAEVEVESARTDVLPGDKIRKGTTGATGKFTFSAPVGTATARAVDPARPGTSPVEVAGTISETAHASLTIDFGVIRVDVEGFVRNASGTPLPGATVELVGFGTSPPTGADGFYRFVNVPGVRSWTIKASHPKATSAQSLSLVLGDRNARQDFTLDIPVLTGRVLESDGTGVAGAQVRVCGGYYYSYSCLTPWVTTEDGRFVFVGRPGWYDSAQIQVTLQDGSNLLASAYGVPFNYYTAGTVEQDVTLPVTAIVVGTVTDHQGGVVSGAQVSLYDVYGSYELRGAVADGNGQYQFRHVQVYGSQPVRVYAESPAGDPGESRGTLEPGQELRLDVSLVEGAELRVRSLDETGAGLGGAVTVQALLAPAADGGIWSRDVSLVAGDPDSGRVHVPLGPFRVVLDDANHDPGAAEGELASGETRPVTVQRGSHVRQPRTLDGPDGSYTTEEWCRDASCGPFAQTVVPGLREGYPPYVRLEENGRALRSLQLAGVGLRVRRQEYVPPSGSFARTLTTLRNTSKGPITVVLSSSLSANPGYGLSGTFGLADPFAVLNDEYGNRLALVTGSRLPAARAEFKPSVDHGEIGWSDAALETDHVVTVDPGQTVAFLTFSLAATDGDVAAFTAKASALVDMSHPAALRGLSAQERGQIVNFDVPPLGDVEGSVTFGGLGIAEARVGLLDAVDNLVAETTTDASGAFAFHAVPPGHYSVAALDPASGRRGRVEVDVDADAVGHASIALLDDTALGSVLVRAAWERIGGPVSDAPLTLSVGGFGPIGEATVVLDASGEGLFTGVPPGTATVRWPAEYRAQPGTVTVEPGQTALLEVAAPPPATVTGFVRGAGLPAAYAQVVALDAATNEPLAESVTDETGWYGFADVRAGTAGFTVRALWGQDPTVQAERSGTVSQAYETIDGFDLDLPVGLVTGQVTFDGVEPVPYPDVFATEAGVADPMTYYPLATGPGGEYSVLVGRAGDYVVTAQHAASGLTGEAAAHVTLGTGVDVPVRLSPSGRVVVTVLDHAGHAVAGAEVGLASVAVGVDQLATTDEAGAATFARVPLGTFRVQARDPAGIRGAVNGYVEAGGASLPVPVSLPETVAIDGEVVGSPTGWAEIDVRSLDNEGVFGPFSARGHAEPGYSVTVPKGRVRVRASTWTDDAVFVGSAEGMADGSASVNVGLGNAVFAKARLEGADGFRLDVNCDGAVGGPADGSDGDPAYGYGAYSLTVAHRYAFAGDCGAMPFDENERELVVGPVNQAGVEITRKVYVPQAGGFARFLTILTNTADRPVTVPVEIGGGLAAADQTRLVVDPSSTGGTYAVTDSGDPCCHPALGFVMAGAGALVGTDGIDGFSDGSDWFAYAWTATLSPGQTAVLMTFAVQRPYGDAAGAQQQAEALAALTDPAALEQMTPEERSRVVNFDVP